MIQSKILILLLLNFLISILYTYEAQSKIVMSEFLNQAVNGSDGPRLTKLDFEGKKVYLLTYNLLEKSGKKNELFKTINESEFQKFSTMIKEVLALPMISSKTEGSCEKEITYTIVENEDNVKSLNLCWSSLSPVGRKKISDVFIAMRKKVEAI